jgi:hypothetical protein
MDLMDAIYHRRAVRPLSAATGSRRASCKVAIRGGST